MKCWVPPRIPEHSVKKVILNLILSVIFQTALAGAATDDRAGIFIKQELIKKYIGARIELNGPIQWGGGESPKEVTRVEIMDDNPRGEIIFKAFQRDGTIAEGRAIFAAWTPALIAKRRVYPGEKISRDFFSVQEINT